MKKGEVVEVLGRLPNGWYRCRALRNTSIDFSSLSTSTSFGSLGSDSAIAEEAEEGESESTVVCVNCMR